MKPSEPFVPRCAEGTSRGRPTPQGGFLRGAGTSYGRQGAPLASFETLPRHGRGWRVFIDELVVPTRIGIHAHEHEAPQPVVVDASLTYRCVPLEQGAHAWIDYERYCECVTSFLSTKPHTRLLETLVVEMAALSFREWPALDALTLALHKPKIREGTRRIGVELDWTRNDHDAWCAQQSAAALPAAC